MVQLPVCPASLLIKPRTTTSRVLSSNAPHPKRLARDTELVQTIPYKTSL